MVILRTNEACYIYQLLNEAILSCETELTVLDDQTAKAVGNDSAGKVVAPLLTVAGHCQIKDGGGHALWHDDHILQSYAIALHDEAFGL